MLRRPPVTRRRPGLLGTAARTAVVAGTATATAGAVSGRQQRERQEAAQQRAAQQAVAAQRATVAPPSDTITPGVGAPASAPPAPGARSTATGTPAADAGRTAAPSDQTTQLRQLADLHAAGALTDAEFAAAKSRLLGL
ncbi:SHOCT domain-containing protein [Catellatospora tritici]|uniref:SHOCT domain-containing protein n=1 Tax=Catellatospora tritici TaxID=2851566 RepID=UPI001C2CD5FC|nr:SHOCT domain-containing protein [Catellatospora tritici]MBV1848925.1 SHOCT domain-containing protein [Catellatospora tritici]